MSPTPVTVVLTQRSDYRFDIDFGAGLPGLTSDEPPPLGTGLGPTPLQLLCAAVGNCLADSLVFGLRKFGQSADPLVCRVEARVGRNPEGRLRVLALTATLRLGAPAAGIAHLERVLAQFEAYCTVTQSVGQGIPTETRVVDVDGTVLRPAPGPAAQAVSGGDAQ